MKRAVLSLLAVCSLVSLTGCGALVSVALSDQSSSQSEEEPADPYALEIGKEVQVGAYSITVTKLKIVNDWDGNKVLKITYDWKNNSGEATSPFVSTIFRGFQDGVETDWAHVSDHIDLTKHMKEAKPGASIIGVEDGIGIADMSKPLVIELEEMFSFDNQTYTMRIDDLNAL